MPLPATPNAAAADADLTVLVLGGTGEGRDLARVLTEAPGIRVVSSLAGRTASPRLPPGEVRIGGFGGADGLAGYLFQNRIGAVVDATHPFAATMGGNAEKGCRAGRRAAAAAGTAGLAPARRRRLDRGRRLGRGGRMSSRRHRDGCCSRWGAASSRPLPHSTMSGSWCARSSPRTRPRRSPRPNSCWPADPLRSTANAASWPGTASTRSSAATAAGRPRRLSSPPPASSAFRW